MAIKKEDDLQLVSEPAVVGVEVDTTQHFLTHMTFQSRDEVLEWARRTGRVHGVVVVVKRSDLNDKKRTPRITLGCERSGGYRGQKLGHGKSKPSSFKTSKRRRSTKKCDCPFTLKAYVTDPETKTWGLEVLNGLHNHILAKAMEGNSYAGRLTPQQKDIVRRLGKTGVKTRDILHQIKLTDPSNASTMKTIYTVRSVLKVNEMAGRSNMLQLFKLLTEYGYVTRHRSLPTTDQVSDLFWAYSPSIQLAKAFPFVFLLDCTYKTNKYGRPLLHIVGVTSTSMTFSVAFCYMNSETEDNYEWALNCFKDLFGSDAQFLPTVFVTDRELKLMNSVAKVFPTAKNLLCRAHIEKNVLTKCIDYFPKRADFDDFMKSLSMIMNAFSVDEYERSLAQFIDKFKEYPQALSYVQESWFLNYKEHFVSAWIDQNFHLGNTTINSVKGSHSKLKKFLTCSVHRFLNSFHAIHLLLEGQVNEIKASFEESLTQVPLRYRVHLYENLLGIVSKSALEIIELEVVSASSLGVDPSHCRHTVHCTHGLPCAHMIVNYQREGTSIPLNDIHNFWKKLTLTPYHEKLEQTVSIDAAIEILYKTFNTATVPQQLEIKKQLALLGKACSTSLLELTQQQDVGGLEKKSATEKAGKSAENFSTKRDRSAFEYALESQFEYALESQFEYDLESQNFDDESAPASQALVASSKQQGTSNKALAESSLKRPKLHVQRTRNANNQNWTSSFPDYFKSYISKVTDVDGDGHCGYRVVAIFNGWENDGWKKVRLDLTQELKIHKEAYDKVFFPLKTTADLLECVECDQDVAELKHWMIMPYMGIVISSCYKVPVVHISQDQCLTFFPLWDATPFDKSQQILVMSYLNNSHFVKLELSADCPLPPVSKMWLDHRHTKARHWLTQYAPRIDKFKKLMASDQQGVYTVNILD